MPVQQRPEPVQAQARTQTRKSILVKNQAAKRILYSLERTIFTTDGATTAESFSQFLEVVETAPVVFYILVLANRLLSWSSFRFKLSFFRSQIVFKSGH